MDYLFRLEPMVLSSINPLMVIYALLMAVSTLGGVWQYGKVTEAGAVGSHKGASRARIIATAFILVACVALVFAVSHQTEVLLSNTPLKRSLSGFTFNGHGPRVLGVFAMLIMVAVLASAFAIDSFHRLSRRLHGFGYWLDLGSLGVILLTAALVVVTQASAVALELRALRLEKEMSALAVQLLGLLLVALAASLVVSVLVHLWWPKLPVLGELVDKSTLAQALVYIVVTLIVVATIIVVD